MSVIGKKIDIYIYISYCCYTLGIRPKQSENGYLGTKSWKTFAGGHKDNV